MFFYRSPARVRPPETGDLSAFRASQPREFSLIHGDGKYYEHSPRREPIRRLLALSALLFAIPANAVDIEWVTVGDPGNNPDDTGFGAVAEVYRISKYEVTNAQYTEFLNAVAATDTYALYNTSMGLGYGGIARRGRSGSYTYSTIFDRGDMPVNWVSLYDALRFANWLHNGQPEGVQDSTTTEDGAYDMSLEGVVVRKTSATIFLTSEDEWYKAAYFNGTSYFEYPAGSDTEMTCAAPGATSNTANCGFPPVVNDLTDVGSYTESASPYGTFDQGGNVFEWNEAVIGSNRCLRGLSFLHNLLPFYLAASYRYFYYPSFAYSDLGFRVASIPEDECSDSLDNDGDGFTDYPDDPGCVDADDPSELSPLLVCDDGSDNDEDELVDYPADPGCFNPYWFTENPQCQDGINNDPAKDDLIDFDGGASAGLPPDKQTDPDPECLGRPWKHVERCGIGAELAFLLPPLMWLYWRRRSRI